MHRPYTTCAVFLFACTAAVAVAQQSGPASNPPANTPSNQDQYQGQSNPPADDPIDVAPPEPQPAPQAKPPAGHREEQPAQIAQPMQTVQPAQQAPPSPQVQVQPSSTDRSASVADSDDADGGIVQVAPDPELSTDNDPKLRTRGSSASVRSSASVSSSAAVGSSADPDGDIVHPAPLPPGVLAEGAVIRARLLTRLSTTDSQVGETFRARVASDVLQDGHVVIPAGAEIGGHVVQVSSGSFGDHGSMRLRPESVSLPDGSHYRLDAQVIGSPGSGTRVSNEGTINPGSRAKKAGIEYGGAVGVGAVTGAAMGGPAGALAGTIIGASVITVHLLMDHPQAVMEPGTVLMFSLNERLNLVSADKASNEKATAEPTSTQQ